MSADFTKAHFGHADAWSERMERYQAEVLADLLHAIPPDARSIIDIGCGNGLITNALPGQMRVVGLDSSPAALRSVAREPTLGDATCLAFPDRSFDVAMANDVIEHLREPAARQVVDELSRVAARMVIVTVPFMEDLHGAAARCARCGIMFHLNHHRRAYDLFSGRTLPVGDGWTMAAQILTGDVWHRESPPIPMLAAHRGVRLAGRPGAICAGCGCAALTPPDGDRRRVADFYESVLRAGHRPTRQALELARTRSELMTIFTRCDAEAKALIARLESSRPDKPRRESLSLLSCDCADPSSRAADLPLWPAEPFWWRDDGDPGRILVGFPWMDDAPRALRISGTAVSGGSIACSGHEVRGYGPTSRVTVVRGEFTCTISGVEARSQFGRLVEVRPDPGIQIATAALDGPPACRDVLQFERTDGFWPLSDDRRLWLSLRRHAGRVPADAWVDEPFRHLSLRPAGTSPRTGPARPCGTLRAAAGTANPRRGPILELTSPSIRPRPPEPGRKGRFLALCHDQEIDRRILQQIDSLVDAGWTGVLVGLSFDGEDRFEDHGPWLLHRVGLRRIVPDDPLYWRKVDAQIRLGETPVLGPLLVRLLERLHAFRIKRLFGNGGVSYPLPFDLCMEGAGGMYPADLVVSHDLPSLRAGRALAQAWRVPLVYDAHEFYPHQVSFTPYQSKQCSQRESEDIQAASHVITVNESIASRMAETYAIRQPTVVLNALQDATNDLAVGNPIRERLGLPPTTRIVLLQGGLSPHRNIESFVGSARHFKDRQVALVLLGSGSAEEELRTQAEREGTLGSSFFMLPAVPPQELGAYSRSADIGVIPYQAVDLNTRLCTPNKLFEYIAAGLPIIATDLPELRRFVQETGFGVVGRTDTPDELASTLRTLLDEPGKIEACREAIRRDGQRFSWAVESHRFLAAIDRALMSDRERVPLP